MSSNFPQELAIVKKLTSAQAHHNAAEVHATAAVEEAARAGADLKEVKGSCSAGEYKKHLATHTTISERMARKYVQLHEEYPLLSTTKMAPGGHGYLPGSVKQALRLIASSDVRETVDQQASDGVVLTKEEVDKMLKDAEDARRLGREEAAAREKLEKDLARKEQAIKKATAAAMEADRQKRDAAKKANERYAALKRQVADSEEVHLEQLTDLEQRIRAEERARPKTPEEIKEQEEALKALQDEAETIRYQKAQLEKELEDQRRVVEEGKHSAMLREEMEGKFAKAARDLTNGAVLMIGIVPTIRKMPLTADMHGKIEEIEEWLRNCLTHLAEVKNVHL